MDSTYVTRSRARRIGALVAGATMLVSLGAACTRPPGGGTGTTTTTSGGGPTPTTTPNGSRLPLTSNVDADGSYPVTIDTLSSYRIWRPSTLGENGVKHPIFVWGPGGGSQANSYDFHFRRLASHGFVIIAPSTFTSSGATLKNALTYIIGLNSSNATYQGKLNTSKVGMGGHSIGSTATYDAESTETRLTTTIHVSGGSFDGQGPTKVKTPTAFMCGANDTLAGTNCTRDFQNTRVPGNPTFFTMVAGTDHIMAARNSLPAMNAWLRLWLNDETDRRSQFAAGGTYFQGIWKSQVKNWS
jgi:dienelactone hydrolase